MEEPVPKLLSKSLEFDFRPEDNSSGYLSFG